MKRTLLAVGLSCLLFGIAPATAEQPDQLDFDASEVNVKPIAPPEASRPAGTGDQRSVLVYFEPALDRFAPQRAAVKQAAVQRGGFTRYEYGKTMPNVINLRNVSADASIASRRPRCWSWSLVPAAAPTTASSSLWRSIWVYPW